jgi:hypothetical protein
VIIQDPKGEDAYGRQQGHTKYELESKAQTTKRSVYVHTYAVHHWRLDP